MKCAKCGNDFSYRVFPLHVERCPGNTEPKIEPEEQKIIEEPTPQKIVPKRKRKR